LATARFQGQVIGVVLSALIIESVTADLRQAARSAVLLLAVPMNLINANQSHPFGDAALTIPEPSQPLKTC
jgi:hypothetical protein